jgi:hypothetical protein
MAAPLWKLIMEGAVKLYPSSEWVIPEKIVTVRVGAGGERVIGSGGIAMPAVAGTEPGTPGSRDALGLDLGSPLSSGTAGELNEASSRVDSHDDSTSLRRMD